MNKKIYKRTLLVYIIFALIFFLAQLYIAIHSEENCKSLVFSILIIPLPFLLMNLGRILGPILLTLMSIILAFNIILVIQYHLITSDMLSSIAGTDKYEALSVLGGFSKIYIIGLIFIVAGLFYTFRIYSSFNLKLASLISLGLLPFLLHCSYEYIKRVTPEKINISSSFYPSEDWRRFGIFRILPGFIGSTYYMASIKINERDDDSIIKPSSHSQRDSLILDNKGPKTKNVILLLGESAFAKRHNLYGYTVQNTTPNQNALMKEGALCFIPKAHSAADFTRVALPFIISFATPDHPRNLTEEKNILELAHENGYRTWWIGSQSYANFSDRPYGYVVKYSDNIITPDVTNRPEYIIHRDNSLIPVFKQEFTSSYPYKFYIIHLIGSHATYSDNYDAQDAAELPNADAYDRTIHHTDRIIQTIIDAANKSLKDYTILYTSDHGEIVSSGAAIGIGHGIQYGGYDQYLIPVLIAGQNHEHYCNMANHLRYENGMFSEADEKLLISSMLGYTINESIVSQVHRHDHVLHSDNRVYDYDNLPVPADANR